MAFKNDTLQSQSMACSLNAHVTGSQGPARGHRWTTCRASVAHQAGNGCPKFGCGFGQCVNLSKPALSSGDSESATESH